MAEQSIIDIVRRYLLLLQEQGLPIARGVIFGSQATGSAHEWSDIDVLVISSLFDGIPQRAHVNILWHTTIDTDSRIQPIPCGERQWLEDDVSTIIEMARREGIVVEIEPEAV